MLSHRNFLTNAHAVRGAQLQQSRLAPCSSCPAPRDAVHRRDRPAAAGRRLLRHRERPAPHPRPPAGAPADDLLRRARPLRGRVPQHPRPRRSRGTPAHAAGWQSTSASIKRLTGINLAPLVFRQIHKALGGKLRFLVSGGAALNPQTQRDFFSLGLPLLQGWGMTEASPVVAVQRFSRAKFRFTRYYEKHLGSVGPPSPASRCGSSTCRRRASASASGGEGEVIVRGPNVFQGYWERRGGDA